MTLVIQKPWGSEELLELNECYVLKKLIMNAGHRCSLQFHEFKRETIFVIRGKLIISTGHSPEKLNSKEYTPGSYITIDPKLIHRMEAIDDCVYLEASTPELDDVVRLSDDYSRNNKK